MKLCRLTLFEELQRLEKKARRQPLRVLAKYDKM
jgi:hypothetical protein